MLVKWRFAACIVLLVVLNSDQWRQREWS